MKNLSKLLMTVLLLTSFTTVEYQNYARKLVTIKEFPCLVKLWQKESNWRPEAKSPTNDYGIPQRNMPKHTKQEINKFRSNWAKQIDWGVGYIRHRYGTACDALDHHKRHNWY